MKSIFVFLFCLFGNHAKAQDTASIYGTTYSKGDTIILNPHKTEFLAVSIDTKHIAQLQYGFKNGLLLVINGIVRNGSKKRGFAYQMKASTTNGTPFLIDLERAASLNEIRIFHAAEMARKADKFRFI